MDIATECKNPGYELKSIRDYFSRVLVQILRIAKVICVNSTSAAVFAKKPGGLDQFNKIFGVGFNISFLL
jgi:hypothetical protein